MSLILLSTSNLPLWLKTLCFLSLAYHSTCSPAATAVNIPDPLLSSSAPSSTTSGLVGAPIPNCASQPDYAEWFQPSEKFDNGDCPKAIELFYNDYTRDHEGIKYEFLASGVTPVHGIPTQRVPLKVAYGTCSVVIAMRNMFVQGELPGETPTRSAGSDISSFTVLHQSALEVYSQCCNPAVNKPGWFPAGDLNSIGLFIWQAGSPINERIHSAPPPAALDLISMPGDAIDGDSGGDTA